MFSNQNGFHHNHHLVMDGTSTDNSIPALLVNGLSKPLNGYHTLNNHSASSYLRQPVPTNGNSSLPSENETVLRGEVGHLNNGSHVKEVQVELEHDTQSTSKKGQNMFIIIWMYFNFIWIALHIGTKCA